MSKASPSTGDRLPKPLHRVFVGDRRANQYRILYVEQCTGDWVTWEAHNSEKRRDRFFEAAVLAHPLLTFARQSHRNKVDTTTP